ncbi:MAG TPA: folate-binding protein [Gammaproteobacteria bacterium]|nr:folate-binding protein [Gammaproteobacteria bacterium]
MHPDSPTLLTELSQEGVLRVSGADAVAFLQGQLSTDIEKLNPGVSQFSSWSNAKGRVVTLLRLFRRDGDIYLSLPAALLAPVKKRLSMYVLRSQVTLEDASGTLAHLGLAGPDVPALLQKAGITTPATVDAMTESDGAQIIRLHGETPRYAIYGTAAAAEKLRAQLESLGAQHGTEDAWALMKIRAGEPTIYPETTEQFVAQMLDLDQLGAIDFKKGCYIGQEVIARAHYRGAVKRHMVRAESRSTVPLRPGADIHAIHDDSPVAEVVDARLDAAGTWQMLLVIQDNAREADLVHAFSGAAVTLASASHT